MLHRINNLSKLFRSSYYTHFHLHSRLKSSTKNSPAHKKKRPKQSRSDSHSLYHEISELVKSQSSSEATGCLVSRNGTPGVCHNIAESASGLLDASKSHLGASEPELDSALSLSMVNVSPIVGKVTDVVQNAKSRLCMEQRLDELGVSFSPDIVEKVLKRCFKVGHLAHQFFEWVKLQPRFRHTTETYNAMISIAGDAREFGLVEKLVSDMDEGLCPKDIKTWTIVISNYGRAKLIGKALNTFEAMKKSGCEPDSGVLNVILRALCNAGNAELAVEFYCEMVSRKMEIQRNHYQMLMNCLAGSGNLVALRSVKDDIMNITQMSQREVYSSMLRSFCVSGKIEAAQELFVEMKKNKISMDLKIHEVLLKGLCKENKMEEALLMFDDMKQNFAIDNKVYGCMIDGFLRKGDVLKAFQLLQVMQDIGLQPMITTYTQMIQQLFRSNKYEKACNLYEDMLTNNIQPDIVAITVMFTGHVQHDQIPEAWKVLESMKKHELKPTKKTYSTFINEFCKVSKPLEALKLLEKMPDAKIQPTDESLYFMRSSLVKLGYLNEASKIDQIYRSHKFDAVQNASFVDNDLGESNKFLKCDNLHKLVGPSADDYGNEKCKVSKFSRQEEIISSDTMPEYNENDLQEISITLSSSADWSSMQKVLEGKMIHFTPKLVVAVLCKCHIHSRAALQFFSWIGRQSEYAHTTETYNMAIKLAGSAKDFSHMRNLFKEMTRTVTVTPDTWTILISQYGQAGLTEISLRTFKEMKIEGYQPNRSSYKYMIVFLCGKKGRKLDEAIKLFQQMIQSGFMPDKETVDIYFSSLCDSGKSIDARRSLKTLYKRGFQRQLGYSLLIKALCRSQKLEEALILMNEFDQHGCVLDQHIYQSIIHALLRENRLYEALSKFEAMKKAGISDFTCVYTSLIVHFCKEKQIVKAEEIFKKMKDDGFVPTVVTFSALIRGYMNMGMIRDAWNIFWRMKLKGPVPDFETYSMFITCLCKADRSEGGLQLIHDMLQNQIVPSAVNFRTVFHGLNREGKHELARSVVHTKTHLKETRMLSV